jgi:hypothetical protein
VILTWLAGSPVWFFFSHRLRGVSSPAGLLQLTARYQLWTHIISYKWVHSHIQIQYVHWPQSMPDRGIL